MVQIKKITKAYIWGGVFFLLLFILFLILPKDGFWIRDCGNKFILLKQGITHSFTQKFLYPGEVFDPQKRWFPIGFPFAVQKGDSFYSQYPFYFPAVSSVFYRWLGDSGLIILPFVSFILFSFLIIRYKPKECGAFWPFLLVFFGTPLLFYSMVFWEHIPSVCLMTAAMIILTRERLTILTVITGFVFWGGAIALREEMLLSLLVFVCIYPIRRFFQNRYLLYGLLSLTVVILVLAFLGYHQSLLEHFKNNLKFSSFLFSRYKVMKHLLWANHFDPTLSVIGNALLFTFFFFLRCIHSRKIIYGFGIIIALFHLACLLFSHDRGTLLLYGNGLFFTWPVVLLMFIPPKSPEGIFFEFSSRKFCFFYVLLVILTCPFITSFGIHWSARILLPIIPFGCFHVFRLFQDARKGEEKVILNVLVLVCVLLQLFSYLLLYDKKSQNQRMLASVCQYPDAPIITNVPWLAEDLGRVFTERKIFYVREQDELHQVRDCLKSNGYACMLIITFAIPPDKGIAGALNFFPGFNLIVNPVINQP